MYLILIMQNVYLALRMYTFGANQCSLIVFLNLESFEHLRLQLISFRIYSPLYLNKSRPASQSESHVLSLSDVVLCNIQSSMEFGRTQSVFRVMPHLVDHGLLSLYAQQEDMFQHHYVRRPRRGLAVLQGKKGIVDSLLSQDGSKS